MTDEQVKALCKYVIDNGNKPLNNMQKELLKQEIDQVHNIRELFIVLLQYSKM